jgi:putative chitinase
MARAVDVVRRVAPNARREYLEAFEAGDALLQAHNITTPDRLAHFLAQVLHESGALTVQFENMSYSAKRMLEIFGVGKHSAAITAAEANRLQHNPPALAERVYGLGNPKKAKELGNTEPGDGYRYRGGGILQTTGRYNYRTMGKKCGVDFEKDPGLVCSAEHCLKPALHEWTQGSLNALADKGDLRGITKRINGGYNGLADREKWFKKVRPLIDKVDFKITAAPEKPVEAPKPSPAPDVPAAPKSGLWSLLEAFLRQFRK